MEEDYLYWIWLNELKGIGTVLARRLLESFESPKNIYNALKEELIVIEGIGDSLAENIIENKNLENAKGILDKCEKQNIKITTCKDEKFPSIDEIDIIFKRERSILVDTLLTLELEGKVRCVAGRYCA